jgi:hypothetical protein
MKKILIIILFSIYLKGFGQNIDTPNIHSYLSYDSLIKKTMTYYSDSISKRLGHKYFFIEVNISQFDIHNKNLKIILDYNCSYPLYVFNPTHITNINGVIVIIRFSKTINAKIIRKLPFKIMDLEKVKELKLKGDSFDIKNHFATGYTQPLVFVLKSNIVKYTWYQKETNLPIEDLCIDTEYL